MWNKEKKSAYMKEYHKKYYKLHKEEILIRNKKWAQEHKEIRNALCRKHRKENPAYHLKRNREWFRKNPEKVIEYRRRSYIKNGAKRREYNKNHREMINAARKIRYQKVYKNDPFFKVNDSISTSMRKALNGNKNGYGWESLIGYKLKDLISHLEKQFDSKMNWNNYGSYWHIDHIKPISLFNFTIPKDKEFKECWALDNLQPLEAIANLKKGNKYSPIDNR